MSTVGRVKRLQIYPQYSDDDMCAFFAEVSKGYCFEQSAERCNYAFDRVLNTLYSDDETMDWALYLSMQAGARIRKGEQPIPDRWDGLFDEYKGKP